MSYIIRFLYIIHVYCMILLLYSSVYAQPQPIIQKGTFASTPNLVGLGARAVGMGGAFIAVADDATAASWNPAGLTQLKKQEISFALSYFRRRDDYSADQHPETSGVRKSLTKDLNHLSPVPPIVLIRGRVIDKISGDPIAGAFIFISGGSFTISDANGQFDLYQIPGKWILEVKVEGYEDVLFAREIVVEEEDEIIELDIEIELIPLVATTTIPPQKGFITGTVMDKDTSEPIEGAWITIRHIINLPHGESSEDGEFILLNPIGTWAMRVFAFGYEVYQDEVTVEEDQIVIKNIPLNSSSLPVLVTGIVKDLLTFEPISGASISSSGIGRADSNQFGEYYLYEILGQWTLLIRADGYATESKPISVDGTYPIINEDFLMVPINISTTTTIEDNYTTTTTAIPCSSELLYGEYAEETELLRHFRNNILGKTPEGQELIRLYYEWSPIMVKAMEEDEEFKEKVKEMIDGVLPLIKEEVE